MAGKSDVIAPRNTVKRLGVWAGLVTGLLMVPVLVVAPWTAGDFIFAGAVLFGAVLGFELATRNMQSSKNRMIIAAATVVMVLFIWALAVAD